MLQLTRRSALALTVALSALSLTALPATAQTEIQITNNGKTKMLELTSGRNNITFKSLNFNLAAHLYTPEGFDASGSYPAVVYSPPFNQVKEQTGAIYARELAKHGYVTIVFDHIGFGESEGDIRTNENAFVKMESIRDAISFMGTLPFVDREKLFGLGMCASGGYFGLVATTDKRIKALATVSGLMSTKERNFGRTDKETMMNVVAAANAGRQKAYETGEIEYADILGFAAAKDAPAGTLAGEGYDFYMTARAGAQTYPTYSHLSPTFMLEAPLLADAMNFADVLHTPYIGIYGENSMNDNGPQTIEFYEKAPQPKQLVEIPEATHVSLYDHPKHVQQAVEAIDAFFQKHGGK